MNYPFSAIVGQELLKAGLLVCAVSPSAGGLLIRGDKGSAKSTAARALAELLPAIRVKAGCVFNCLPGKGSEACEVCSAADSPEPTAGSFHEIAAPFVTLPLGATEEMVIGTADLKRTIAEGRHTFRPGLLACANRGILYIDEVNLLSDHLVDVILDAAAMGVNHVQREGISTSHRTTFSLVGTMNEEEGELRPQLLDRFGMMVDVETPGNVEQRVEVVRRRLGFESNDEEFLRNWSAQQEDLKARVERARELVHNFSVEDSDLRQISEICSELRISSLRADIVMAKVSIALAALSGRRHIVLEDLKIAAQLVLPHRKRLSPGPSRGDCDLDELLRNRKSNCDSSDPPGGEFPDAKERLDTPRMSGDTHVSSDRQSELEQGSDEDHTEMFTPASLPAMARIQLRTERGGSSGRRSSTSGVSGRFVCAEPHHAPTSLALQATVNHSLIRNAGRIDITADDLHQKVQETACGNLIVLVVDSSSSLAAVRRMEAVKGAALALLQDAYQKRDRVAVIYFRGQQAELVLPPTRSIELAQAKLRNLETGGRTPLADALVMSERVVASARKREKSEPLLVLLSDGRANVSIAPDGDAWEESLAAANRLRLLKVPSLVVDSESGAHRFERMRQIADALGGEYHSLEAITSQSLTIKIRQRLKRGAR